MKARFNSWMKKGLAILAILLLSLVWLAPVAWAIEFKSGQEVIIGPDEVIEDDLYVGAEKIVIEGTIKGDLVAAGGEIVVNGTVEEDLIAAAGYVTINGNVQDDARIAGGALTLGPNARIGDDALAAGYSFETAAGSTMGGSLFWGGYQAKLAGEVEEDFSGGMGALEITGRIRGNVKVDVGEPDPDFEARLPFVRTWTPAPMMSPGFRVAEGAEIGGKLTYTSGSEGDIAPGAAEGGIVYQTPVPSPVEVEEMRVVTPQRVALNWFLDQLRRFIALLVVGLLLVWVVPRSVQEAAAALQSRPWGSLGWGVLVVVFVCIAVPVIAFLMIVLDIIFGGLGFGGLVVSVTGLGFLTNAAIVVSFLIAVGYITKVVVSFLVGRMILGRIREPWGAGRVWPLVVGVVIFALVRAIPILGWFIGLFVTLFGLGALWLMVWAALRRRRAVPA
jgi:hypothetical protein